MNHFLRLILVPVTCLNLMAFAMENEQPFQCKVPIQRVKDDVQQSQIQKQETAKKTTNNDNDDDSSLSFFLDVTKDIALAYCILMFSNYIHELGHLLTHTILYQKRGTIHIGQPNNNPWLRFGGIFINSLNPFEGAVAALDINGIKSSPPKNAAIALAGPIVAGLWNTWKYTSLHKKHPQRYVFSKLACMLGLYININQLVPFRTNNGMQSDGMLAYRSLNGEKIW